MNPKPPHTLNKETIGVWHGWANVGDKEVAREAAAKGSHIKLVVTFLSLRRKISFVDAETWFREEVLKWVHELLERKQIFKATHVLNNVQLDPAKEFSQIFYSTNDKDLREYIGNHLKKIGSLDENLKQLWSFLNLILKNAITVSKYKLETESIEFLNNLPHGYKAEIATVLFLETKDRTLVEFLTAETLWERLIINRDLDNLLNWINIQYNSDLNNLVEGNAHVFQKLSIGPNMLHFNSNTKFIVSSDMKNAIYNEFSKFGIFSSEEKDNVTIILERLKNSFSIAKLYNILAKNSSVVSLDHFINLLVDYCVSNRFYSILNICVKDFKIASSKSEDFRLINNFRLLVNNFNEISLRDNIFNVSHMLSDDITSYFKDNPTILLAAILFSKDVNITDMFVNMSASVVNKVDISEGLKCLLEHFHVLKAICHKTINGSVKCDLTVYDLLNQHTNIPSRHLFEFRFSNSDLPHFSENKIVDLYGYSKTHNYKFYLKQSKPSTAAKLFILSELETYSSINEDNVNKMMKKVCHLAITKFDNDGITSSCVAFVEIIGMDSLKLRVLIEIAKILYDSGYDRHTVLDLLINSYDEPYTVQNYLENILIETIEANSFLTGSHMLEAFNVYDIVVQYSKLNNIKLPELLLRYCGSRNLWLPFLIFAQMHKYPLDQIKPIIQFFRSPNMLEHLTHGIVNDIQSVEKNVLIRDRDSRNYLISKVGVRRSTEHFSQNATASQKSQSSFESEGSSGNSDLFEIDVSNIKATLLQTLIRCHNSTDPPKALLQACQLYRNPLLAIFATSYEPDSIQTNWLTWLAVSCEMCQVFTNYESTALSAHSVSDLLENCLRNRFPKTLLESFQIFIPDNPLRIYLEFLNSYSNFNYQSTLLSVKLELFRTSLTHCRETCIVNGTDREMTYRNNKMWIELTAIRLLSALLDRNCDSLWEQILILESLHDIKFWKYFACYFPNLHNLLNVLKALYYSGVNVKLNMSLMFDVRKAREAIISCINTLLEKQQYEVARQIAQIESLPPDLILVKEWQNKINANNDKQFWYTCNDIFVRYNVTADCVVDFYVDCAENLPDLAEKFALLKLSKEWAVQYELSCQFELEKKMLLSFLRLDEKYRDLTMFDVHSSTGLYKDWIDVLKTISPYEGELSADLTSQLERVIAFALNQADFWLAMRLQKMFSVKTIDLEILKLCHSLAEGMLLPCQLNAEQRLLVSNLKRRTHRKTLLPRISSFGSSSLSPSHCLTNTESTDTSLNDTLIILKMLSENLHNGIEIGQNIYMKYRISINIEIPYQVIVETPDYMKILKYALEDNCMNKLEVVHDFISVYKWSKHEVADFICEEVINAISYCIQRGDAVIMWDLNVDQHFQFILQLLQDNCSILGHKINSYCGAVHRSQVESESTCNAADLTLIIELTIRAHDCFTADCNMEGISIILKQSKDIVFRLLAAQEWKVIVRLLTGVARYSEMNYIFQILMENDQFEYLLRRDLKRDNALKMALLDYMKRFCPDNRDLYKIVALHFSLFSEVATLWEREAENVIKNQVSISKLEMQNNKLNPDEEPFILFQNTDGTKICLNKAMKNYIHATDFHLQGEKLAQAMCSAKQAELLALQLALLNEVPLGGSVPCLLYLNGGQISSLILSRLTFEQSWIVIEAYNVHADWASVLYEQFVVKNNAVFFDSFLQHLPLSDSLVHDISRKFIAAGINSVAEIKCMKNIISRVSSLHTKYRIASELGFTDLVEDLVASGQLVYLKDTVWKKGYRN